MTLNTQKSAAKKTAFLGIFAALAVAFSFLESLIPQFPFMPPGGKAGFSNIITMYTATFFSLPWALCVSAIKSIFVLFTRGFTAFLLSFGGGIVSTIVMWMIYKKQNNFGFTGIGICGAVSHNTVQLLLAVVITETTSLYTYIPPLLLLSVITGTITGILMKITIPRLYNVIHRSSSANK